MSIAVVIGSGMMGSALAFPLSDNGHSVRLVGSPLDSNIITSIRNKNWHPTLKFRMPPNVTAFPIEELDSALAGADCVVGGISSFGVDWFTHNVIPRLPPHIPVISVTKGLHLQEDGSLVTFPEYIQSLNPNSERPLCAIGGPCTSYELAARQHSSVAFCGNNMKSLQLLRNIFQCEYYHVMCTTDVRGVETAVAMKNAYALAVSMAIGIRQRQDGTELPEAYNPQAAIFAQSIREISRMLSFMHGKTEHIDFGAADLYVTVFGGRTRRLGIMLGKGMPYNKARKILSEITLESVEITGRAARAVRKMAAKGLLAEEDFPLLLHVDDVITRGVPVCIPWDRFR